MRKQKQLLKKLNLAKILFNLFLIQLLFNLDVYAMSKTEKFLEIVANSEKASYFIKFNDVKIFSETSNSPIRQTLPVNHWSNNGKNKLLISVNFRKNIPLEIAKNSKLHISVFLRVKDQGIEKSYLISEFNLSPSDNKPDIIASSSMENFRLDSSSYLKSESGDIIIGPWNQTPKKNWIRFEQDINIDLNLPKWAYLDADYLGSLNDMTKEQFFGLTNELYEEYRKIWELMKSKDIEKILDLTALRSMEMNKAFHLAPNSKENDMRKSLSTAFSSSDLYLDELIEKERAQLSISANGKILNIKVAGTTEPPIYFSHTKGSFTRMYDFYFMKKDGKWIIIR